MLRYLLNTTCIWLLSLVMFDLLLRRDSFHSYNRAYLLFTFLLGIILPLCRLEVNTIASAAIATPAIKTATARQAIVQAADTVASGAIQHSALGWDTLIWAIYFSGVFIVLFIFIIEIIKLISLFKRGTRTINGKWIIIETNRSHAPCSLLHYIFVSSRSAYDNEQWATVLKHEQRHGILLHIVDVLLIQFAKIIFWFHPLVYLYEKRLLLVHEYQADRLSADQPKAYGQFLIEQAMLQSGSSISHSLIRSSIRKRIVMLTKRSARFKLVKLAVIIPLLLCCIVCFTQNGFSNTKRVEGNKIFYNGNIFETRSADTEMIFNGNTNKVEQQIIQHAPTIVKMNNEPVYKDYSNTGNIPFSKDVVFRNTRKFYKYLFDNSSSLLQQLDDGKYEILLFNTIVDEKGKLAYYDTSDGFITKPVGLNFNKPVNKYINKTLKAAIDKKIHRLIEDIPSLYPVHQNGKAVPFELDGAGQFEVKDHHIVSPGFISDSF